MSEIQNWQRLHLFFDGERTPANSAGFGDPSALRAAGICPSHGPACDARKAAAQSLSGLVDVSSTAGA